MNGMTTLTTMEKSMNMEKLGIVLGARNCFQTPHKPRHYKASDLIPYTLCANY